ncbi:hypothetical protein [Halorussus salinus]|uniref:hypothetical protein n=1 Tax=Halorussus salinus TaxID=1364935 RepID=UPI00138F28C2|nr:hypothetical protein [Halorussus salinus]
MRRVRTLPQRVASRWRLATETVGRWPAQNRNCERVVGRTVRTDRRPDDSDSFLHEELVPTLIVLGVLLVLFPDPLTSSVGLVMVAVGAGMWLRDLLA